MSFGLRKFSLSLSTWFCIPEQGMRDMEILSRSSASVIKRALPNSKGNKFYILTSSHVVAPWRWPKYYPEDWLRQVSQKHTHYTVELRHPDGMFITSLDLIPKSIHHPNRDFAVLEFEDSDDAINTLADFDYKPLVLSNHQDNNNPTSTVTGFNNSSNILPLLPDHAVIVSGHEMIGQILEDGTDMRKPVPKQSDGWIHSRSKANQCFITTSPILTLGMCGGPVIRSVSQQPSHSSNSTNAAVSPSKSDIKPFSRKQSQSNASSASANTSTSATSTTQVSAVMVEEVVGVIEGIVPLDYHDKSLAGLAVMVESHQITQFLNDLDDDKVPQSCILQGGEAAAYVGSVEVTEDDMDIVKVIEKSEGNASNSNNNNLNNSHNHNHTRSNFPL